MEGKRVKASLSCCCCCCCYCYFEKSCSLYDGSLHISLSFSLSADESGKFCCCFHIASRHECVTCSLHWVPCAQRIERLLSVGSESVDQHEKVLTDTLRKPSSFKNDFDDPPWEISPRAKAILKNKEVWKDKQSLVNKTPELLMYIRGVDTYSIYCHAHPTPTQHQHIVGNAGFSLHLQYKMQHLAEAI